MKKFCSFLLGVVMCVSLFSPALAAESQTVQVSKFNGKVMVDGTQTNLQLDESSSRSPLLSGDTLYITLPAAGQWLGADVAYDEAAKAVTITHNGKEPVYYTWSDLKEMGVVWGDWEGLDDPFQHQSAQLRPDVTVIVDGTPQSFANAQGKPVYPLFFQGYIFLPIEVVSQLGDKQMLEFPDGFMDYLYLYDVPTQAEYDEAKAYLVAVRGRLDAVHTAVKGPAPKTGEEYAEKIRQMQEQLKAIWMLPEPAFKCMKTFVERIRYQAELVLWQNIDPRLPAAENSGARPSADVGPIRPISWVPEEDSNGRLVYVPGADSVEAYPDPKNWAEFTQAMITEETGVTTYFLGLKAACANSEDFLSRVTPLDAPTGAELDEANAYIASIQERTAAVRALLRERQCHTDEEFTANVRSVQAELISLLDWPQPASPSLKQRFYETYRQVIFVLSKSVDPYLPEAEASDASLQVSTAAPDGRSLFVDYTPERKWAIFADGLIPSQEGLSTHFMGLEKEADRIERVLSGIAEPPEKGQPEVKKPIAADPTAFSDAKDIQHWEAVASLAALGVISGKDDGAFHPTDTVTRGECAKLIASMCNGERDGAFVEPAATSFSDTQDHWAAAYIQYCTAKGVISGRGNGAFDPDNTVTTLELCKMALCALGYDARGYKLDGPEWDRMTDTAARTCAGKSLYTGLDNVSLGKPVSRDDAAQILYNALQAQPIEPILTQHSIGQETGTVYDEWQYRGAVDSDGEPLTLLYCCFAQEAFPAVSAQPTV